MALPGILWSMHQTADRQSGADLHNAYSSYCGAHGALARLSYGQIFGGVTTGTKSLCHFAPVIKFGVFVDSTITYDKTSSNWPDWYTLLADSPILCADGEALTGFKHQPASNKFRYECSRIGRNWPKTLFPNLNRLKLSIQVERDKAIQRIHLKTIPKE